MHSSESAPPIARTALHEEVTQRLREMIVELRLKPGERIQELEVARQLGVSRTPIREAIKVLTAEGLVELLPLRGAIVKSFSARDARNMLDVIALLEEHAGRCAVDADPDRIDAIVAMHEEMVQLYARGERLAYFNLNQQIHQALIALADNETLSTTHASLSKRMRGLRYRGNSLPDHWAAALAEHNAMMEALRARDGQALAKVMGQHIRNTWPRIKDELPQD
ncbi:GntR family transcriptional regulator [Limnohabitans sp.]|jgi:DNA-binding GntR family transcriptional regulator|uniref:GntR family transcriptional regulator n=1 Tax=Limnohabitans sp. TaxID=1907725 RepID=UPI00391A0677